MVAKRGTGRIAVVALVSGLFALGCASTPVPAARVASAKAAIRAADEVGASHTPAAALHLQLAREEFARAKRWIAADEPERAEGALARAESDAELALAMAREDAAASEAQRSLDRIQALQASLQ